MKPASQTTNGLEELARKYVAKVFNIKPRNIKITEQRGFMSLQFNVDRHIPPTKFTALARVLQSKGLKLRGSITSSNQIKTNKTSSVISFDLQAVKYYRKSRSKKRKAIKASFGEEPMSRAVVLADSLAQNMRFGNFMKQVARLPVQADSGGMNIKVMRAGDGARLVQQLYNEYISEKDYTGFLDFYKSIDDTMFKFRGNKELDLTQLDDDDDDDRGSRRRGKKGKKSFVPKNSKPARLSKDDSDDSPPDPSDQSVVISADKAHKKTLSVLSKYYP